MIDHCHHNCLEELTDDHKKILEKINELEKAVGVFPMGKAQIKEFLHFSETFVEPHLQKEEKVLFPALEQKGIPNEGGPIGMMLLEHETKRGQVKKLKEDFEQGNEEKIKENCQALIVLLRDHIFKEDNILYPCGREVLTEEELNALASQCEKIK